DMTGTNAYLTPCMRMILVAVVAISFVSLTAPARASEDGELWWEKPESVSATCGARNAWGHELTSDRSLKRNVGGASMLTRPSRQIIPGKVSSVEFVMSTEDPDVVGVLQVTRNDGEIFRFRVFTYTLILIRDAHGKLWAGRLKHLRPGWACEVAFDLPPDEDDNIDFRPEIDPLIDAASVIADSFHQ
ncbi:MAG TPA: hypothetical protein PKO06_10375, partial [Candidatus Ozemobacteraceae bacterium]|nr:hypothetical protein [Candidatus Ozemobacteraceae bacterium]